MATLQFLTSSRVLIVAGKGGVGKSTVSAALALAAARSGIRTVHVTLDSAFPRLRTHESLVHMTISPGRALADYLSSRGLGLVSRQLANSGLVELVASTAPGIDDLLVLGKIKSLARDPGNDLIIVDGPAAGHALDLLRTPTELRRAVSGGPIRQQADEVLDMLADPAMCRVALVTTPAMTPVTETIEAAQSMSADSQITSAVVIVNMCDDSPPPIDVGSLPDHLRDAVSYASARARAQRSAIDELDAALSIDIVTCARHKLDGADLIDRLADDLTDAFGALSRNEGRDQ